MVSSDSHASSSFLAANLIAASATLVPIPPAAYCIPESRDFLNLDQKFAGFWVGPGGKSTSIQV